MGNSSVGKSVFIRNALDLRRSSVTQAARSKVILGGALYRLQLIEVPLESVDVSDHAIVWSSIPELAEVADVDGVLCLYDVSQQESLQGVPQLLHTLEKMGKTTCLVSCKVDVPQDDHEVGPGFIDRVSTTFPGITIEEARSDSSDTAKRCLLKILKEALVIARRESRLPHRARSQSNDPSLQLPRQPSQNLSTRSQSRSKQQAMRSRSRENTLDVEAPPLLESSEEEDTDEEAAADRKDSRHGRTTTMPARLNTAHFRPRTHVENPQTPMSSTENVSTRAQFAPERASRVVPQTPESFADPRTLRRGSDDTAGSQKGKTFLDIDDDSPAGGISPRRAESGESQTAVAGDTPYQGDQLGVLVDRLLSEPMSKGDHKFIPSFLCLYRVFATPLSLLVSIIDRFIETEESDVVVFAKASDLLRYLSVLGLWTAQYPGDFADLTVRDTISIFVSDLARNKSFAPAARQIANNLQTHAHDEDEDWAFVDKQFSSNSARKRASQLSQARSDSSRITKGRQRHTESLGDAEDSDLDDSLVTPSTTRHSAATSSASSLQKNSQGSNHALDNLHQLSVARENARKLRAIPQRLASKVEHQLFLSLSVEELASEITRMDWTVYTSIRPRDFVRYVTMPSSQRSRLGRMDYIAMMTRHFNNLALFTSGMILLGDKPKYRARVLEKFMDLAWKVRQMNNYHALGAIVAALSGEAIVRLSQTHELIPPEKHKQFLRLKILMGHQKSHAAYRMAWENSSAERIPYLPRIQEDLTKAAQGNPTFVGASNNVNWRKFEIMGDTIVSIQRSQEKAYKFPDRSVRGREIEGLILETKILEGEVSSTIEVWSSILMLCRTDSTLSKSSTNGASRLKLQRPEGLAERRKSSTGCGVEGSVRTVTQG